MSLPCAFLLFRRESTELCIKEFSFFDLRENLSLRRNQRVSYSYIGQLLSCKGKEQFFLFSPMISLFVHAWMFAKITRLSSPCESSRQLFKLERTTSFENCSQHWPPFEPWEHPNPSCRNFVTLAMISSLLSTSSRSHSAMMKIFTVKNSSCERVVMTTRPTVKVIDAIGWCCVTCHCCVTCMQIYRHRCSDTQPNRTDGNAFES